LKNLFGPVFPEIKPAPKKKVVKRAAPKVVKRPPPPKPLPVVPQPVVPRVEPMPVLTVMGFLNKENRMTAFLSGSKGEVYLVKAGDTFGGDLQVRDLSASAVVVVRARTGQSVRLPFAKAKTQRLPDFKFQSGRPNFEPPAETEPAATQENNAQQPQQQQPPANQSPVILKLQ